MKHKILLIILVVIVITAFFVGCAEQDALTDNGDDREVLSDDEVKESIDEGRINGNNDDTLTLEDLSEKEVMEDNNDVPESEEFSSTTSPFETFNQARENKTPTVIKFYSDT